MNRNLTAVLLADWSWAGMSSSRPLGIALWVGLAALTIALLVLMWTRWGQVRPLSKCAVLSLFVHLLFMCYAYGTKLILQAPAPLAEDYIELKLVTPATETMELSKESLSPWEKFISEEDLPAPEITPPERVAAQEVTLVKREVVEWEVPVTAPLAEAAPSPEIERPTAEAPEPEQIVARSRGAEATEMDAPSPTVEPTPREQPVVPPAQEGPQRIESTLPLANQELPTISPDPPSELVDPAGQVQSLSEIAPAERATAVPDEQDRAELAANKQDQEEASQGSDSGATEETNLAPGDQLAKLPEHSLPKDIAESTAAQAETTGLQAALEKVTVRHRLGDGSPLPEIYQLRMGAQRAERARSLGGTAETEAAVEAALAWLAANQSEDGRWNPSQFEAGREAKVLGHDRQGAGADAETGITGLALLAFMGAGHTHLEGTYRKNVQYGLEFLLREQKPDGNLAGSARLYASMYCHGMAALALSEAYGLTGDHRLEPFVRRAIAYTVHAQHPTTGGWRYLPGDQGDMSQFGWQVMALCSAELAGIEVPQRTREGMHRFFHSVSSGTYGGLASYRVGERPSRTMTAEALASGIFLKLERNETTLQEAVDYVMEELPQDGMPNCYYWYYATLALFQRQGPEWPQWNEALQRELLARQRKDGSLAGSWDPETVWGRYGGRVYSTAVAALCLEVYYRYLPLYEQPAPTTASRPSATTPHLQFQRR